MISTVAVRQFSLFVFKVDNRSHISFTLYFRLVYSEYISILQSYHKKVEQLH